MSTNNSQFGNTPSEPLFENNNNEINIDHLISLDIVLASQPLIQFTTANMIPSQTQLTRNVAEHDNVTRRQQRQRRRRQRQRLRRQEQQEEQRRQRQIEGQLPRRTARTTNKRSPIQRVVRT